MTPGSLKIFWLLSTGRCKVFSLKEFFIFRYQIEQMDTTPRKMFQAKPDSLYSQAHGRPGQADSLQVNFYVFAAFIFRLVVLVASATRGSSGQ